MARIMLNADQEEARAIGIAGTQAGIGASTLARLLARAYVDQSKRALLVDARAAVADDATSDTNFGAPSDLMKLARDDQGLMVLDLATHTSGVAASHQAMRALFDSVADAMTVVVDLPPVDTAASAFRSGYSGAGSACDLVYLVCPSGTTRRVDLANYLEVCRINRLKVGGIVINDSKVFGSRILASHSPLSNA
jgi:Mrp family chromosome partitioning ATPase